MASRVLRTLSPCAACALALCCVGAVTAGLTPSGNVLASGPEPDTSAVPDAGPVGAQRYARAATRDWQQLLTDYARNNVEYVEEGARWTVPATEGDLQAAILPVLVMRPASRRKRLRSRPKCFDSDDMEDEEVDLPPVRRDEVKPRPAVPGPPPQFTSTMSPQELVDMFQSQAAEGPYMPPLQLSAHDASERAPPPVATAWWTPRSRRAAQALTPGTARGTRGRNREVPKELLREPASQPSNEVSGVPSRLQFDRSLLLRGELTVPRADYSESYVVRWDADSGSARVDLHGGSTTTFRSIAGDGSVTRVETHVDRAGGRAVRRCSAARSLRVADEDRALPALPPQSDLDQFAFVEFVETVSGRAELWRRVVVGRVGEAGGARDEALTAQHDLVLQRTAAGRPVPLTYTVSVSSSVLGADCDGYQHRYTEVREQQHVPAAFTLDTDEMCDDLELVDAASPEQMARLEPLREFTMAQRDPRYDAKLQEFVTEHQRNYSHSTEEAVRKNLIMQNSRFVTSGNRQGATVELGANFLSDRLDAELEALRGVQPGAELRRAERFPHARAEVAALEDELPAAFDWRDRGAVSAVRYQGSCSSCWAFAVAGAVEGALYRKTGRLVPLSEKCLVDCAHSHGANGCGGTWPSRAYDYIRDRGLPALDEYTPYREKVDRCVESQVSPVTRISGHINVTRNSVPALKVSIRRHAPTVVIVDAKAKSFISYKRGVLYDERCGKSRNPLNHAVVAVGWGESRGEPHFILKNSWSSGWGEGGYIRLQARGNTCGVLSRPSVPRLERADVQRNPAALAAAAGAGEL